MEGVIVGIDEVGRGPLAGPLVAAAVALPTSWRFQGIKDSKLLTKIQREKLITTICRQAIGIGIGWVGQQMVDDIGLTEATHLAMAESLAMINCDYEAVIIDGNYNFLRTEYPTAQTVVRADQIHESVMAAAIVAKVARDRYMNQMAKLYPNYGFDQHVGYGTKLHKLNLQQFGPCSLHRLTFATVKRA